MIVTDHFVYLHTSRSAGTFLNKLIMEQVPGARMLQYHGHLKDLPGEFAHLPVIGFVRNPWDWYVSMIADYRRKQQYVFQVLSNGGVRNFEETVTRFLTLGEDRDDNKRLLRKLVAVAPKVINVQAPQQSHLPGLRSDHFAGYPANCGYYSWLFQLMYETETDHDIHIGRFENLREEALRLLETTGTPISSGISSYLGEAKALNSSPRREGYVQRYSEDLAQLVADKDAYLIDRFNYAF